MDVRCDKMESACVEFAQICKGKSSSIKHISFSRVNTQTHTLKTISTSYEWHLDYWAEKLNLHVASRILSGVTDWQNKNKPHLQFLAEHHIPFKTDYTFASGNHVDILSIATDRKLTPVDIAELGRIKPMVNYHVNQLWRQNAVESLPY